ncbi:glucosidase 2 subunit beta, partial [Callorhinchus milii]|uniref:glucosidase 2 subunit beta n=1 Tax=Callorhinchus milii TaxID=7868 RepID=UPI001C3FE259
TSACPNGNFHCTNAGFRPRYIPASRVNDGICDCCDATDEYNSGIVCDNTCKEQGRKEKETLQQMAEVAKEGFRVKQQLIEEAKRSREDKQKKLEELAKSKTTWESQVELLKAEKDAAEKPEKEAKDKHHKMWEEIKALRNLEKEKLRAAEAFQELDDDQDGTVTVAEIQTHVELDSDADGAVSEQEGETLLGGVSQVDVTSFQETVWAGIKDKYKFEVSPETPAPPDVPAEEKTENRPESRREEWKKNAGDDREEDEEEDDDDDDDEGDDGDDEGGGAEEEDDEDEEDSDDEGGRERYKDPEDRYQPPKKEVVDEQMPPYEEQTQELIDAADRTRSAFSEAEKSLKDLEDSIRSIEKELTIDFGPYGEFAYLFSQCYEMNTNEYVYRLCPFNKVVQRPKHGGTETSLGQWGSWSGPEGSKFSAMRYEHGTACWQGPSRSTLVKLTCGKDTAVLSTSEPSRCEYLMEFTTPAFCQEPSEEDHTDHDEL